MSSGQAPSALSEVADRIKAGERVAIIGQPSVGKSTVLRLLANEMPERTVVRVGMPTRGDDAGPIALASLAAQIGDDALKVVRDLAQPWSEKLRYVLRVLGDQPGVVVLIDDAWISAPGQPTQIFDDHATELLTEIADLKGVGLAFTAKIRPGFRAVTFPVERPGADDKDVLKVLGDLGTNPSLQRAASTLVPLASALRQRSPVELRLAVALVNNGMMAGDVVQIAGARKLARAFVTRLPPHMQSSLHRLAVLRLPCDLATRDQILGNASLIGEVPLDRVAMYETSEGWVLPSLLIEELFDLERERRLPPDQGRLEEAHRIAANFHQKRFSTATERQDVPRAVRHELEVIHHLTQAGDANAVLRCSLWFVEQYDSLGKVVGTRGAEQYRLKEQKRLKQPAPRPRDAGPPPDAVTLLRNAITAYERALAHDQSHAYALHYLAYNHDVLAEGPADVEKWYRAACVEDPGRVWHHGRLITFLVTRGRPHDAHVAWDDALRRLDGLRDDAWLYHEIHRPLALLLLHRGNTEFADEVLDDVPEQFENDGWFPALRRRLALLLDHERDALVFPPSTPPGERWSGPRLALNAHVDRWLPGRIESVDEQHVSIRYADRDGEGRELLGHRRYTHADFQAVCEIARAAIPPSGTFVELLWLAGVAIEQIRCHLLLEPDELPPPFPPPDRYLTRGAAGPHG